MAEAGSQTYEGPITVSATTGGTTAHVPHSGNNDLAPDSATNGYNSDSRGGCTMT